MTQKRVGDDEIVGAVLGVQVGGAADLEYDPPFYTFRLRIPTRGGDQMRADVGGRDGRTA